MGRKRIPFWEQVEKTKSCWLWKGATTNGYGYLSVGGKMRYAHRVAYQDAKGDIPPGLELDHLCRVKNCVNPDHLEAVSHKVNMLRSDTPSAQNSRKEFCKNGHPLSGANLYRRPDGRGRGDCLTCKQEYFKLWKRAHRREQSEYERRRRLRCPPRRAPLPTRGPRTSPT